MSVSVRCYAVGPPLEPEKLKWRVSSEASVSLVQTVSTTTVSNETFAEAVVTQTLLAMSTGNLLAKKPEIDLLLRLAGTTQISEAIETAGATAGRGFLLIVAAEAKNLDLIERSLLRGRPRLQRAELSKSELMAVERAALLNALRV